MHRYTCIFMQTYISIHINIRSLSRARTHTHTQLTVFPITSTLALSSVEKRAQGHVFTQTKSLDY